MYWKRLEMLIVPHLGTPNSSFPVASICFTGARSMFIHIILSDRTIFALLFDKKFQLIEL